MALVQSSREEVVTLAIEEGVAIVTLNRPEAANARNQAMRERLHEIWTRLALEESVSVVVLTGSGERFFCAGMDLKEAGEVESAEERRVRMSAVRDIEELAALPQPTIAAINGYALGGGLEMALACDLRIAASTAQLGLTEVPLGLIPGGGGTQRLPRLIGPSRAAAMIYLGARMSASESCDAGIVNECVAPHELSARTFELARAIAGHPRHALLAAKALLTASQSLPLPEGLAVEFETLLELMARRAVE